MTPRLGIIDYGMGNLHSVSKALLRAGADPRLVASPDALDGLDAVVLPGVGHFGEAMERLEAAGFPDAIAAWRRDDRPFLGICLGMQVLFEASEEAPGRRGLGLLPGRVRLFPSVPGLAVPAMGWNVIRPRPDLRLLLDPDSSGEPRYYFVHSYYCDPADPGVVAATASYGVEYAAAVADGRLLATQFHPEKSGDRGLALLERFVAALSPAAAGSRGDRR